MIIELIDNHHQFHYLNTAHVVYIKQRKNYGLWKIVLMNGEHILTDSEKAVNKIIKALQPLHEFEEAQ